MADSEAPYDPSSAVAAAAEAAPAVAAGGGGRGRGRGRGRGGGGVAIEGIAELDASMGRGAPMPPAGGGGKPLPKKDQKDFRGPAGLFKQGDWTCTVCGNVNWERRSTCNKCQNAKPNLANTDEVCVCVSQYTIISVDPLAGGGWARAWRLLRRYVEYCLLLSEPCFGVCARCAFRVPSVCKGLLIRYPSYHNATARPSSKLSRTDRHTCTYLQ